MRHPILYGLMKATGWLPAALFLPHKIHYEDKNVQKRRIKGGAIVVSNHKSLFDFFILIFVFFWRKLYVLCAEVLYTHGPFLKLVLNTIGGIKVSRNDYDMSFLSKSVALLRRGKTLMIFPEGRLVKDKSFGEFKPSYISLALEAGVPIIPIYNEGSYGAFKRNHMIIGKPIYLSDYLSGSASKEDIARLNEMLVAKMASLKETLERRKKDPLFQGKMFAHDVGKVGSFALFNPIFRTKFICREGHPTDFKIQGHYIISANHSSFKDPILLMTAFWRRRTHCLTAKVVFDHCGKIRKWGLSHVGCISIDREAMDLKAMSKSIDVLNRDLPLIVFPEGKLNKEKELAEFKLGPAMLSSKTGAPILPLWICKKKHWYNRERIYVGEPIEVSKAKVPNMKEFARITDELRNRIQSLRERAIRDGNEHE